MIYLYNYLYNNVVSDLASLFTSKTTIHILRTLSEQFKGLPLRHIAVLVDLPVFSVQRSLQQLSQKKIVTKKIRGRYALFTLNPRHPSYQFILEIFSLERQHQKHHPSDGLNRTARDVLQFCVDSATLFENVKGLT